MIFFALARSAPAAVLANVDRDSARSDRPARRLESTIIATYLPVLHLRTRRGRIVRYARWVRHDRQNSSWMPARLDRPCRHRFRRARATPQGRAASSAESSPMGVDARMLVSRANAPAGDPVGDRQFTNSLRPSGHRRGKRRAQSSPLEARLAQFQFWPARRCSETPPGTRPHGAGPCSTSRHQEGRPAAADASLAAIGAQGQQIGDCREETSSFARMTDMVYDRLHGYPYHLPSTCGAVQAASGRPQGCPVGGRCRAIDVTPSRSPPSCSAGCPPDRRRRRDRRASRCRRARRNRPRRSCAGCGA